MISGNAGNNILDGGAGIDTVSYASAAAAVTVNLASTVAQNTVGAGTDTLLNFENLTGSNFNDTLTGNAGNNVLNGGAGADHLIGGLGNDTYVVDNAGDVVTEAASAGTDTVQSSISYTLGREPRESDACTGTARDQRHRQHAEQQHRRQCIRQHSQRWRGADTLAGGSRSPTPSCSTTERLWTRSPTS